MEPYEKEGVPVGVSFRALWNTKHYRIYPASILYELRHSSLSNTAVLCWQMLFKLAYFDHNWSVLISTTKLAQLMHKSKITVKRCLHDLEEGGYIRLTAHPRSASHRIFVRFPQAVVESLLKHEPVKRSKKELMGFKREGEDSLLVKLKLLWETRFFYAMPCPIFEHLLRSGLPDSAILCWQALLEKACLAPDFSIQISVRTLAKQLNKSESCVSNYLSVLEEGGYIMRTKTSRNIPDRITVTLPDPVLRDLIQSTPDRAPVQKQSRAPKKSEIAPKIGCSVFEWGCSVFVDLINTSINTQDNHKENNSTPKVSSNAINAEPVVFSSATFSNKPTNPASSFIQPIPDENRLLPPTANVIDVRTLQKNQEARMKPLKERITQAIHKSIEHKPPEKQGQIDSEKAKEAGQKSKPLAEQKKQLPPDILFSLEAEAHRLRESLKTHLGLDSLTNLKALKAIQRDPEARKLNNRLADISHQILRLKDHQTRQNQETKAIEQQAYVARHTAHVQQQLTQNPYFVNTLAGERVLRAEQLRRLEQCLKQLGFQDDIKYRLINEVVYEIRFGSLVKCQTTQAPQSTERAINIALKLIREGRWNEPTRFFEKLEAWSNNLTLTQNTPSWILPIGQNVRY